MSDAVAHTIQLVFERVKHFRKWILLEVFTQTSDERNQRCTKILEFKIFKEFNIFFHACSIFIQCMHLSFKCLMLERKNILNRFFPLQNLIVIKLCSILKELFTIFINMNTKLPIDYFIWWLIFIHIVGSQISNTHHEQHDMYLNV